jgi:hypothetical protein
MGIRLALRHLHSPLLLVSCVALLDTTAAAQWSTAVLSSSRNRLAATSVGTRALFAGGYDFAGVPVDDVDLYDDSTGTWSTASLSLARGDLAAASVAGKAFFAGGTGAAGASDVVDVYDAASGTWTQSNLSVARPGLVGASVGTKVLFAGGYWTDVVDVYDTATGVWSVVNLSQMRGELTATTVGSRVYFAGGWTGTGSDVIDVYDDSTGAWTQLALSVGRNRLASATVGDRALFAGGGSTSIGIHAEVDLLTASTGALSTALLSSPRELLAGATAGTRVLFAGGYNGASALTTAAVDVFDSTTGTWTVDVLSQARWGLAATSVGAKAFFAGGVGATAAAGQTVDIYTGIAPLQLVHYCSPAAPNSTGQPAAITALGSSSVSANDVTLRASALPLNSFGYFLTSRMRGFVANPGGSQGNLCLSGAIGRFVGPGQVQNSGLTGVIQLATNLGAQPTPLGPVQVIAGDTWAYTAWYRDTSGGGATSNFTSGVEVVFQ